MSHQIDLLFPPWAVDLINDLPNTLGAASWLTSVWLSWATAYATGDWRHVLCHDRCTFVFDVEQDAAMFKLQHLEYVE